MLSEEEIDLLGLQSDPYVQINRGAGCENCGNTGYRGRLGIYELLVVSDNIRHVIGNGDDASVIRNQAVKENMRTLREDALSKFVKGITTPEEIMRVTRAA